MASQRPGCAPYRPIVSTCIWISMDRATWNLEPNVHFIAAPTHTQTAAFGNFLTKYASAVQMYCSNTVQCNPSMHTLDFFLTSVLELGVLMTRRKSNFDIVFSRLRSASYRACRIPNIAYNPQICCRHDLSWLLSHLWFCTFALPGMTSMTMCRGPCLFLRLVILALFPQCDELV